MLSRFFPSVDFVDFCKQKPETLPVVSISKIRIPAVIELYTILLNMPCVLRKIPDTLIYLELVKDLPSHLLDYNQTIVLKTCHLEAFVHRKALFYNENLESQCELNLSYHKILLDVLHRTGTGTFFPEQEQSESLNDVRKTHLYAELVEPLFRQYHEKDKYSSNMEFIFTKISILEEYIYNKIASSRRVTRIHPTEDSLSYLMENLSLFEVETSKAVFQNESSTEPQQTDNQQETNKCFNPKEHVSNLIEKSSDQTITKALLFTDLTKEENKVLKKWLSDNTETIEVFRDSATKHPWVRYRKEVYSKNV